MKENSCRQIIVVTRILAAACLASMALCPLLWRSERNFPLSPVFENWFIIPAPYDLVLPLVIACSLLLIVILRQPRIPIIIFLVLSTFLCLGDMNRWQPWFFQYYCMMLILSAYNFRCDDTMYQKSILHLFRLMIAGIYIWSGLQKLNPRFLADTFPWLMEPFTKHFGHESFSHIKFLGYFFPFIEMAAGIMLLIAPLRRGGQVLAISMHLLILVILSPLGHNYNPVVWPWNVAMIIFTVVLFRDDTRVHSLRDTLRYHSLKLVFVLFLLMPLFNFFNRWDSYLSHNLYSGNTSGGVLYFTEEVKKTLPEYISKYSVPAGEHYSLNIKYWCMMELGVPAYPENRNFQRVRAALDPYISDPSLIYYDFEPKLKAGEKEKADK